MGERETRQLRNIELGQAALGRADVQDAIDQRQYNEDQLRFMEMYLGSDEQFSDTFYGREAEIAPYTSRYELDEGLLGSAMMIYGTPVQSQRYNLFRTGALRGAPRQPMVVGVDKNGQPIYDDTAKGGGQILIGESGAPEYIRERVTEMNSKLDEAEQHARAGDMGKARAAQAEAERLREGMSGYLTQGFTMEDILKKGRPSAEMSARGRLAGPQAQAVGTMLRESREMLEDPSGPTGRRFMEGLTAGAEREIEWGAAQTLQQQRRDITQTARQYGSATNPNAMAAIRARATEETMGGAARAKAQLAYSASQFFETFRRDYAQNAVNFAQGWAQNAAGIRENFQASVGNLTSMLGEFRMQLSSQFGQHGDVSRQIQQQQDQAFIDIGTGVLNSAVGGFTGGM